MEKAGEVLQEGQAKLLLDKKNIFYNPVQEFNRDLSIAVLSQYSKERSAESGLRILEALSATGLRSIRYAKEVPGVAEVLANDIAAEAVESIRRNAAYNEVGSIVKPSHEDATMVMYQNRKTKFDAVDLDPYGCPSIFLDGAVQCLNDNGLLLVTATDMAILAGNFPQTCYTKYGSVSLKSKACHEIALRILLQCIAGHAARYGKCIVPLLSVSADFYIRVFVKVYTSKSACKLNTSNLAMVYQCVGCESMTLQPLGITTDKNQQKLPQVPAVDKLCEFCQHKHHLGGPIWIGPLHDKDFVHRILAEIDSEDDNGTKKLGTIIRIRGVLHMVYEELEVPLYYQLDRLTSTIRVVVPPMVQFRSALLNAGYKVSYSHANKTSIKTDAPNHVLWDIIRAWEKEHPVKREKLPDKSPGLAILNGISVTKVSFEKHDDAVPFSQQKKLRRFQVNPVAFWGPGSKSTVMMTQEAHDKYLSKKKRNQNKKRKKEEQHSADDPSNEEKRGKITEEDACA
ncbi:probable tRNA (guanine(26)-N(2))-dimethyltransferase [Copidosoma floridanum]|uniref:probable tRNA (guanine(26)-N(2))-dimethyltransferase n=1 Tax=Copidosoma floridanum TaxID=29053 RepID=UPI0006C99B6F|nr:probable tRNA (guanine(26)-N(2))-dimethyltransferase [Copidosoma floridanum]